MACKHLKSLDKAIRPSISNVIWVLSSGTICQFNHFFQIVRRQCCLKIISKNNVQKSTIQNFIFLVLPEKSPQERCQEEKDIKKNSHYVLPIPLLRPRCSLLDPPQHHNHPFTPTLQTFTGHPSLLKSPSPSLLKAINQSLLFTCTAASSIKEGSTWK